MKVAHRVTGRPGAPAGVLSNSLGSTRGMTGLRPAAREAGRVDRLVVLCTVARLDRADNPATPPWQLERIATEVADGKLLVVPEAAHLANAERPAVVTPAVVAHLLEDAS